MSYAKFTLLTLVFVLCLLIQISSATDVAFPQSVIKYMATRQMRYHHYLWHQVRGSWNEFDSSTKAAFQKIGWEPPNPAEDSKGNTITTNYAGEDFLYMHRQMIATANQIITKNKEKYGQIKGWTTVPAPGDKTYPVPAPYQRGSESNSGAQYKTDAYYDKIQKYETKLKDPAQLKKMTLNQLGLEIESGIHNSMHMRWAGPCSAGYRGGGNIKTGVPNISKQWDDVKYDWLVDTYSSHVNPVFWKLHGWIDDRIEDWRKAHGLSSVTWKGTWTGGPMTTLGVLKQGANMTMEEDPEAVGDILEQAIAIFLKSGVQEISPQNPAIKSFDTQPKKIRKCKKASKI